VDLKLGHYSKDGIEVVNVEGEIDIYTAPRLRELLIDLVSKNSYQLVVNLEKVGFLDSTGLGVLVGGLKRVRPHDGSLDLVCTQERILKIFKITGLTTVFGIYQTVDQAIAAQKGRRLGNVSPGRSSQGLRGYRRGAVTPRDCRRNGIGPVAGHVRIEASAQLRSRSACSRRRAARDTTRRSRRHAAVRSAIFMHSAVLRAVFSKVDTPAVFMAWFLPAPRHRGGPATEPERTLSRSGGQTGGLGACRPWRAGLS
jgi:anti-sigma B factor antagonist